MLKTHQVISSNACREHKNSDWEIFSFDVWVKTSRFINNVELGLIEFIANCLLLDVCEICTIWKFIGMFDVQLLQLWEPRVWKTLNLKEFKFCIKASYRFLQISFDIFLLVSLDSFLRDHQLLWIVFYIYVEILKASNRKKLSRKNLLHSRRTRWFRIKRGNSIICVANYAIFVSCFLL